MKKNIWHSLPGHPEIYFGQYVVPNFVSSSICIKVTEQEYILISPGMPLLEAFKSTLLNTDINDNIKIHIIIPNSFHYMGVGAWQKAFSNTQLYASRLAIPRLIEKSVIQSEHDILALQSTLPPWPQGYSVLFPPGHRAGDVWVRKQESTTACIWITCDSFLNYERLSNQPIARFMQRLLNAAPGLKISQVIKWFILKDKNSFKTWVLHQLKQDKPTMLIPGHGEVNENPKLMADLENLVLQRL